MRPPPDTLKTRAATLGGFAGAMWLVRFLDMLAPAPGSVAGHGIIPRTMVGIEGIPVAPLIHSDLGHLVANTIPFLVLGALILFRGVVEFVFVVLTSGLIAGFGTWLFGAPNTHHIGASGIVFGFFGYLLVRAAFDRRWSSVLITILVAVLYGGAMLYALIPTASVSWSGHFFGFVGGVTAARLRYGRAAVGR
jgi:membrane associated rhomboid family serine protease